MSWSQQLIPVANLCIQSICQLLPVPFTSEFLRVALIKA